MATIKSFEDLKTWQRARSLSRDIYFLTKKIGYTEDPDLKRQIKRSAGSVMDNIVEGFERGGNKEFIQFLYIAKGSCGEVRSQLYRGIDNEIISESEGQILIKKTMEVSSMIQAFIKYLKSSSLKGDKFIFEEPELIYEVNNNNKIIQSDLNLTYNFKP